MREIRFRAWDGTRFYYFDNFAYTLDYNDISGWNVYPNKPDYKGPYTCGQSSQKPVFDLQQYTGLNDKNGKEIYEGDKITCRKYIGGNFVDYSVERGYVGFKNGSFYLVREQGFYRPLDWFIEYDYEIEVTGNIYEVGE